MLAVPDLEQGCWPGMARDEAVQRGTENSQSCTELQNIEAKEFESKGLQQQLRYLRATGGNGKGLPYTHFCLLACWSKPGAVSANSAVEQRLRSCKPT
jgi:hypothetical protein